MRYSAIVSLVCLGGMSMISQAVQPPVHSHVHPHMGMNSGAYIPSPNATPVMSGSAGCACGQPAYAPAPVNTCSSCGGCGGCGSYSGLCNNPAAFYEQLYAEFYARNPWYLIAKEKENADRRARLIGIPQTEPEPVKPAVKSNKAPDKSTLKQADSDSSILEKSDASALDKSAPEPSASDK